jgi:4-hydroxybenzoate polyprenyltransferase
VTPLPEARRDLGIAPYVAIARPGHWTKNLFLVPGVLLAHALDPNLPFTLAGTLAGLLSACLVSAGNYVLNELLDAGTDVYHPTKVRRSVPSGAIDPRLAYLEWLCLLGLGFATGFAVNPGLGWSAVLLALMGTLYNLPPFRLKDRVYMAP